MSKKEDIGVLNTDNKKMMKRQISEIPRDAGDDYTTGILENSHDKKSSGGHNSFATHDMEEDIHLFQDIDGKFEMVESNQKNFEEKFLAKINELNEEWKKRFESIGGKIDDVEAKTFEIRIESGKEIKKIEGSVGDLKNEVTGLGKFESRIGNLEGDIEGFAKKEDLSELSSVIQKSEEKIKKIVLDQTKEKEEMSLKLKDFEEKLAKFGKEGQENSSLIESLDKKLKNILIDGEGDKVKIEEIEKEILSLKGTSQGNIDEFKKIKEKISEIKKENLEKIEKYSENLKKFEEELSKSLTENKTIEQKLESGFKDFNSKQQELEKSLNDVLTSSVTTSKLEEKLKEFKESDMKEMKKNVEETQQMLFGTLRDEIDSFYTSISDLNTKVENTTKSQIKKEEIENSLKNLEEKIISNFEKEITKKLEEGDNSEKIKKEINDLIDKEIKALDSKILELKVESQENFNQLLVQTLEMMNNQEKTINEKLRKGSGSRRNSEIQQNFGTGIQDLEKIKSDLIKSTKARVEERLEKEFKKFKSKIDEIEEKIEDAEDEREMSENKREKKEMERRLNESQREKNEQKRLEEEIERVKRDNMREDKVKTFFAENEIEG